MKSKVDPLVKLLDHRQGEASRALIQEQRKLEGLELERDELAEAIQRGEATFDAIQSRPSNAEDHVMHQRWLDRMRTLLEVKKGEIVTQQEVVEQCRETLAAIHLELKTLEKYKENLMERILEERKAQEAKELDEIAGQNHRRQEA